MRAGLSERVSMGADALHASSGGSWAYRIQGRPLDECECPHADMLSYADHVPWVALPARISLMQYYGNDGELGHIELEGEEDEEVGR